LSTPLIVDETVALPTTRGEGKYHDATSTKGKESHLVLRGQVAFSLLYVIIYCEKKETLKISGVKFVNMNYGTVKKAHLVFLSPLFFFFLAPL
jgi:hypothetical protein